MVWGFMDRPQPIASELFDTRFNDMEHELRLVWPVTTKTSINARVGHFARKHAHFSQRDFSGFVGNFDINWAITAKTRITAAWARDISNFQTASKLSISGFRAVLQQLCHYQPFLFNAGLADQSENIVAPAL